MRQLATLPSADTARTFADYLLTLKIDSRLEQEPDGWSIWVFDEDQLPRARQELEEFTRNPSDARYQAVSQTANNLRQRQLQEDRAYQRRQERFDRRMSGPIESQRWTIGIIVVCVLVSLVSRGGHDPAVVEALSITPYRIIEGRVFFPLEGLKVTLKGPVWRLVTPIFLHIGIAHLLFNMYMLYYLGGAIERRRGPLRYLLLVFLIAVASNLVQYYFGHPFLEGAELKFRRSPFFGDMSGVDYGLFGYIWMKSRFQPQLGLRIDPSMVVLMVVYLFFCMTPLAEYIIGRVANGAHVGGLLAGMVLGFVPTLWSARSSG